jgi:hypothetical protein
VIPASNDLAVFRLNRLAVRERIFYLGGVGFNCDSTPPRQAEYTNLANYYIFVSFLFGP